LRAFAIVPVGAPTLGAAAVDTSFGTVVQSRSSLTRSARA
jgi:hypothetical protein